MRLAGTAEALIISNMVGIANIPRPVASGPKGYPALAAIANQAFQFHDVSFQFIQPAVTGTLAVDVYQRAVIPKRAFAPTGKALPDFVTQVSVVQNNRADVVQFVR